MPQTLRLTRAVPVIFVADVKASAEFFNKTLGFETNFLHGEPPFYGSVSRDGATIHLVLPLQDARVAGAADTPERPVATPSPPLASRFT